MRRWRWRPVVADEDIEPVVAGEKMTMKIAPVAAHEMMKVTPLAAEEGFFTKGPILKLEEEALCAKCSAWSRGAKPNYLTNKQ